MINSKKSFEIKAEFFLPLKYGENPYQEANLYTTSKSDPLGIHNFTLVFGKLPGFINLIDLSRIVETVITICGAFDANKLDIPLTSVAVKHGNACGAGVDFYKESSSIEKMLLGDLDAVMGGVVACNFAIGKEELQSLFQRFTKDEAGWRMLAGIACTSITQEALQMLTEKGSSCFVVTNPEFWRFKLTKATINKNALLRELGRGAFLVQSAPNFIPKFTEDEACKVFGLPLLKSKQEDLLLAWAICANSNSNTITIVRHKQLLGNGVGQQSRVRAAKLAIRNAKEGMEKAGMGNSIAKSVAWSDSFFPFTDGVKVLRSEGITTLGATLGSKNDQKVIDFCSKNEMTFVTYPDAVGRAFSNH